MRFMWCHKLPRALNAVALPRCHGDKGSESLRRCRERIRQLLCDALNEASDPLGSYLED